MDLLQGIALMQLWELAKHFLYGCCLRVILELEVHGASSREEKM